MLTLFVTLRVSVENCAEFLRATRANAAASTRLEPECHRFDVIHSRREDDEVFHFYEVYSDLAAFDAHRATEHFAEWKSAGQRYALAGTHHKTFGDLVSPSDTAQDERNHDGLS